MSIPPEARTARFADGTIALFTQTDRGCRILDHLPAAPAVLMRRFGELASEFGTCAFHSCRSEVLAEAARWDARIDPAFTFFKQLGATRWHRTTRWFFSDGDRM